MAILQSINGQFYQIPDEEAEKFLVPADKVEETLRGAGVAQQQQQQPCCAPGAQPGMQPGMQPGGPMPLSTPSVIIYVGGGGPPRVMQAGAGPQGQVQAYHDGHHGGGGHGGGWHGGGWAGFGVGLGLGALAAASYPNYNNYYNYQNYMNQYGGGW